MWYYFLVCANHQVKSLVVTLCSILAFLPKLGPNMTQVR